MSACSNFIIESAKRNKELAVEIYCELYIYNNYTESEIGREALLDNCQYNIKESSSSWLNNLMYRIAAIFNRRGISIEIGQSDIEKLMENTSTFRNVVTEIYEI